MPAPLERPGEFVLGTAAPIIDQHHVSHSSLRLHLPLPLKPRTGQRLEQSTSLSSSAAETPQSFVKPRDEPSGNLASIATSMNKLVSASAAP
jgi:hypothetical protein